jgi:hypothetical protein
MLVSYLFQIALLSSAFVLTTCIKNPCKRGENGDVNKFFPHPEDEHKFIQCSNFGQMFEFSCGAGLVWSQKLASCQHGVASNSKVADTLIPTKPTLPPVLATQMTTQATIQAPTTSETKNRDFNSILTFDNEICQNLEIKNSNLLRINGLYSKSFDSKLFKRSDNVNNPGLIGTIRGKWCITYEFPSQSNINRESILENCGSNFECCLLVSEVSDWIGLSNQNRLWKNSFGSSELLDLSCKVENQISQGVNSVHRPFKVNPQISSTDKIHHENVQKEMLHKLLEDQLLLRVVFRPNQNKQKQLLRSLSAKNAPIITTKPNIATLENIKVNLCEQIRCPTGLLCGRRKDCEDCNPMCFHEDKAEFKHAIFINCDNVMCPAHFECFLDETSVARCVKETVV